MIPTLLCTPSAVAQTPPPTPPPLPAGSDASPPQSRSAEWAKPPEWRIVLNSLAVFRYNELGIEEQLRVGVQKRLYDSPSPLFRDNFIFMGMYPKLNPAYMKIGASIEFQPVSFFNLRAAAELDDFFGTFGYLQSYQSPLSDYSPTARELGKNNNINYGTAGTHFMLEPTIQLKFKSFAVRNKMAFEYWRMSLHASDSTNPGRTDPVFYDATLDTLVPADGWVMTNDLDLLYVSKFGLTAGLRYSIVKPFYSKTDFMTAAEASQYSNQNAHQRLGVVAAYTFFDHGFTRFNKPTVLLIVAPYLDHRYRTGQDISQAVPYVVVGFAFQSDLLH